jgi:hypothetical protein
MSGGQFVITGRKTMTMTLTPVGASVSGGKNPVPNSTSQESAGGGEVGPATCLARLL